MKASGLVALLSLSIVGCTNCAAKRAPLAPASPPDTSKILKLAGRWTTASACPVSAHHALTAAHVVDPRPFDKYPGYVPVIYQQGGHGGTFTVRDKPRVTVGADGRPVVDTVPDVSLNRDIAVIETGGALDFYPIATDAPKEGDAVWLSGYDFRDKRRALADRVLKTTVVRIVAGRIYVDPPGWPSTSGSCLLNAAGEVVGINTGGLYLDSGMPRLGQPDEIGFGWLVLRGQE